MRLICYIIICHSSKIIALKRKIRPLTKRITCQLFVKTPVTGFFKALGSGPINYTCSALYKSFASRQKGEGNMVYFQAFLTHWQMIYRAPEGLPLKGPSVDKQCSKRQPAFFALVFKHLIPSKTTEHI